MRRIALLLVMIVAAGLAGLAWGAGADGVPDADMSQPESLTKCGGCHTGGGISEYDLRGQRFLSRGARPAGPRDPGYTIRDREKGEILAWDVDGTVKAGALGLSDPALENCAMCHGFTARNATTIRAIQHADILRGTEKAGWIYNGAKISDTMSPKIPGKESMTYPMGCARGQEFDLHRLSLLPEQPGANASGGSQEEPTIQTSQRRPRRLPEASGPQFRAPQHSSRNGQCHPSQYDARLRGLS
jgi:cytochrome c553